MWHCHHQPVVQAHLLEGQQPSLPKLAAGVTLQWHHTLVSHVPIPLGMVRTVASNGMTGQNRVTLDRCCVHRVHLEADCIQGNCTSVLDVNRVYMTQAVSLGLAWYRCYLEAHLTTAAVSGISNNIQHPGGGLGTEHGCKAQAAIGCTAGTSPYQSS